MSDCNGGVASLYQRIAPEDVGNEDLTAFAAIVVDRATAPEPLKSKYPKAKAQKEKEEETEAERKGRYPLPPVFRCHYPLGVVPQHVVGRR